LFVVFGAQIGGFFVVTCFCFICDFISGFVRIFKMAEVIKFFDAHTHVQFAAYAADRDEVINRARRAGVGMVNVGTQKDTSSAAVALAERYTNLYAAVGLHPTHTAKSYLDPEELGVAKTLSNFKELENAAGDSVIEGEVFDYEYYKKLAEHPKVVAIGECGLDYYRETSDKRQETRGRQKEAFIKQIELAYEVKKPLMIHCRSAFDDLIEILNTKYKTLNTPPGIIHFFSGTTEDAKKLLDMGFYFTFGGVITFARDYDEVIKMIPADRILSETDAPYVTPAPYRGKRNEPAYVIEVVKKLAEIKGVSLERMAEEILQNAEHIFNLKLTTS
jgi:TatD DNase family protein